ncbi:MAG: sterol desaturase family protein [Saprospiraceae bacterium]
MFNPTEFSAFQWLLMPMFIFGRYVVLTAVLYFVFYVWKRRAWFYRKIQQRFPTPTDYQREIGYSALTSLIFGGVAWLCLGTSFHSFTQFYTDIDQYGVGWLIVSIPLTLLIHDTYFYWIHRLMHWPPVYRLIHLTHHRSVNPSPWAAFAFHPMEAVAEAGIIPILLLVMPLHPISFFGFVTMMLLFNVYGHLGYELFPIKMYKHPLGKWLNTSIYHNLHHEKFTGNYGLYFTFWDRLCGTLREDGLQKVEEVHGRERPISNHAKSWQA